MKWELLRSLTSGSDETDPNTGSKTPTSSQVVFASGAYGGSMGKCAFRISSANVVTADMTIWLWDEVEEVWEVAAESAVASNGPPFVLDDWVLSRAHLWVQLTNISGTVSTGGDVLKVKGGGL